MLLATASSYTHTAELKDLHFVPLLKALAFLCSPTNESLARSVCHAIIHHTTDQSSEVGMNSKLCL